MREPIVLTIDHLGARGDGVAHDEGGRPVFVPLTAPGDRVQADESGAYQLFEEGEGRQTPPCPHFGQCGGCALQHVRDDLYAVWLSDRINQALSQHDLITEIKAPQISPAHSRRRASFQGRWDGTELHLGFAKEKSHSIIDIQKCPVLRPEILGLLPALKALLKPLIKHGQGVRVEVTVTQTGLDVLLEAPVDSEAAQVRQTLSDFAEEHHLARLACRLDDGLVDIIVQRRLPFVRLSDVPVILPPAAFLQATVEGENALVKAVREAAGDATSVADLFAGLGTFTFALSQKAKVHAVEGAKIALDALVQAGATQRRVSVEHRDLFRRPLTVKELNAFDAVVFDPPRAGAKAQAELLAQTSVETIIGVSCNPNTFARDAELIAKGGYKLSWVQPVGQFLWSREVELVALFKR